MEILEKKIHSVNFEEQRAQARLLGLKFTLKALINWTAWEAGNGTRMELEYVYIKVYYLFFDIQILDVFTSLCTQSKLIFLLHPSLSINSKSLSHSCCNLLHPRISRFSIYSSSRWAPFQNSSREPFFAHSLHVAIPVQVFVFYII